MSSAVEIPTVHEPEMDTSKAGEDDKGRWGDSCSIDDDHGNYITNRFY